MASKPAYILAQRHRERRARMQELADEENPPPVEPEVLPPVQQAIDATHVFEPTDIEAPDMIGSAWMRQSAMQPWRNALMISLKRRMSGRGNPQALQRIADRVVKMACAGDMRAVAEIGDRLDGKALQPSEMTITNIKQVPDDELERRLAERIAEASASLLTGPDRESGTSRTDGGAEASDRRQEVREESD